MARCMKHWAYSYVNIIIINIISFYVQLSAFLSCYKLLSTVIWLKLIMLLAIPSKFFISAFVYGIHTLLWDLWGNLRMVSAWVSDSVLVCFLVFFFPQQLWESSHCRLIDTSLPLYLFYKVGPLVNLSLHWSVGMICFSQKRKMENFECRNSF